MPATFVNDLKNTSDGKVILVNMWDTVQEGLVNAAFVKSFFMRCAANRNSFLQASAAHVRDILLGADGGAVLVRKNKVPANDGTVLSTVAMWSSFWQFHVNQDKALAESEGYITEFPPESLDASALDEKVQAFCRNSAWWNTADAHLGPPDDWGGNCWVSTADHDAGFDVPHEDLNGSAWRVTRALGLLYDDKNWVVQYSFSATEVRTLAQNEIARPTFCDLGSPRFRFHTPTTYGRNCAHLQWGTTAHLAKQDSGELSGRPERVVRRIPIEKLNSLHVSVLGIVAPEPGEKSLTEDEFFENLLSGRSLDDIANSILTLIA